MPPGSMPCRPNAVRNGTMTRLAVASAALQGGAHGSFAVVGRVAERGGHCRDQRDGMSFAVLNMLADKRELLAGEGRQRRLRR